MLRLAGILTGSALAITALFVVTGVPQLSPPTATAVVAVPQGVLNPPQQVAVTEPQTTEPDVDEPASIVQSAPTAAPLPRPEADSNPVLPAANDGAISSQPPTELPEAIALESKWFAFWSPFRSQVAADGFVSELQRTTGLDYRVVKIKPGVYEVAFEYSDDLDREDKLSQIAAATGLDLSDG